MRDDPRRADGPAGMPVFFSGGTALQELARTFVRMGCRTAHLVTTFDSGGSTARLRKAFNMPAPGDLRNRLVALADPAHCNPELVRCMDARFPSSGDPAALRAELLAMKDPAHSFWQGLGAVQALTLQQCLHAFLAAMPADFDARTASLGNLFMAGKYLLEHRSLSPVMGFFSRLLHVQGEVLPIMEESLHLAARLVDGSVVVGQHLFRTLPLPIEECFLTVSEPGRNGRKIEICRPRASTAALARLRQASLVCYPMGSFFSSIVANLLVDGVGSCVASLNVPKIFVPNTGVDRELSGHTLAGELMVLLKVLQHDGRTQADASSLVTHVVVDPVHGRYPGGLDGMQSLADRLGIEVVPGDVVEEDGQHHNPSRTAALLLQLAGCGHA